MRKRKRGIQDSLVTLRGDALLGNDNAKDLLRIFNEYLHADKLDSKETNKDEEDRLIESFLKSLLERGEKGDGEAQFALGYMYRKGLLFEEDDDAACRWLLLSSSNGNPNGQCSMGVMYYWGKGVKKDHKKV